MVKPRVGAVRRLVGIALISSAMLLVGLGQRAAQAETTAVKGSAYGYYCTVVAAGVPCSPTDPTPMVTLPVGGANPGPHASAQFGSATVGSRSFFSSGPSGEFAPSISVDTFGTLASESVYSSADINNVNTSGTEPLTATRVLASCRRAAGSNGDSQSASITGGTLRTDSGDGQHPPVDIPLPANPDPNTTYTGHVHVNGGQEDFTYVFNEQTVNSADGSVTVNAAHEYLSGTTTSGELIIGQAFCERTYTPPPPPPEGSEADLGVTLDAPLSINRGITQPWGAVVKNDAASGWLNDLAATARGINVTFTLNPGDGQVLYVLDNSDRHHLTCKTVKNGLSCPLDPLAPDASIALTAAFKSYSKSPISGTTTVSSSTPDPNPSDNSRSFFASINGY